MKLTKLAVVVLLVMVLVSGVACKDRQGEEQTPTPTLELTLTPILTEPASKYVSEMFTISTNRPMNLDISGDIIVWNEQRSTSNGEDIFGYNLDSREGFEICARPDTQHFPAVSGTTVVWQDGRNDETDVYGYNASIGFNGDIYSYNLSTGVESPICTDKHSQWSPAISGDIVVWVDERNGNADIYGYNLSTGIEFPICTDKHYQWRPAISGDIVVWEEWDEKYYDAQTLEDYKNADIYGFNLTTSTKFPICTTSGRQGEPAISGDNVVWVDDRNGEYNYDIYGYNLKTDTEFPVCTKELWQSKPDISGDIIVWHDEREVSSYIYSSFNIYGYNLNISEEFAICIDPAGLGSATVSGDIVVIGPWGSGYITGARLSFE